MGREIKFRAWDGNQMWFTNDRWMFIAGYRGCDKQNLPDAEIMQYTGLKDKNGAEIYEGDIIIGDFVWGGYQGIVKYSDGCFHIAEHGDASFLPFYDHAASLHEVIGNIHENPELLEETL